MAGYLAVVNPAAGGGRCRKRSERALAQLREAGVDLDIRETNKPGHATEIVRDAAARGHRRFLSVGGDGTAFEVVNGLFPRADAEPDAPVLGLVPLGTGNSFLRDFGISDAEGAVAALLRGTDRPCDVVRTVHADGVLHYLNLLSVGFSARAGSLTNRRFKRLGAFGYVLAVLACTARLRHAEIPIRVDGGPPDSRRCVLLSFSNSRYTGGTMMMAPKADPTDGALDVIRVGPLGRMRLLGAFPRIFRGTHMALRDVEQSRARRVDFEGGADLDAMVDGEVLHLVLRSIEVVPAALRVIA